MDEILYQVIINPQANTPLKLRVYDNRIEYETLTLKGEVVSKSILKRTIANIEKALFFDMIAVTTLDGTTHSFSCKNSKVVINEMMKYL